VNRLPTALVGLLVGLVVGMTSVGSGSLMIVALMVLYPTLRSSQLVGTDLVQAVPLVASAALAQILFGDFKLGLTLSILAGSIPGVWMGSRISSRSPDWVIRPALLVVFVVSGLKLLNVNDTMLIFVLVAATVVLGAGSIAYLAAARPRRAEQLL
jgi:uncharacterized membrane protein YfcA